METPNTVINQVVQRIHENVSKVKEEHLLIKAPAVSRQSYGKNWKPADRGSSPVGLVVTLGSSRPEMFSVDFRMLPIIFPLNNLLFNLLIFCTRLSGWCCSCGGLLCTSIANRPSSWESGKPITLEGKLLPHRARRVIDLFFQLPTMLAYNLKRQKLILVLGNRRLLGKQGRLGTWVRSDIEYLYLMTWDQATYSVFI